MAHRIKTPLTDLLKVDLPILSAPMAIANSVDLAIAVTSASAYGSFGVGFKSSADLKHQFTIIREKLNVSEGDPIPIGVGFLGWVLDKTEISEDPRIDTVLEAKPTAVWFAFGVGLGKYVAQVRAFDARRDHKTIIFANVNSVEEALVAANDWKVDVIVAQGIEAGGHGGSEAPPLFTLLPAVLQALPNGPLVVAAGGIATGSQIASLLTMGAAGVVCGTRFLFTHENAYPPEKRELLLQAGLNATTRSLAFDEVGKTMGWPPKCDGRAIANEIITDAASGLDLEERVQKFDESAKSGDKSRLIVWAGVGVGLTNRLSSVAETIIELEDGLVKTLESAKDRFNISGRESWPQKTKVSS